MTKHFRTTFTHVYTGKQIVIDTKVTDRMEERGTPHKKALADQIAIKQFEKDHIRYIEVEERGFTAIVWRHTTEQL